MPVKSRMARSVGAQQGEQNLLALFRRVALVAPGAEFDHRDGRRTFVVLIDHFDLGHDPALLQVLSPRTVADAGSSERYAGSIARNGNRGDRQRFRSVSSVLFSRPCGI